MHGLSPSLLNRLIAGVGRATGSASVQLRIGADTITWTRDADDSIANALVTDTARATNASFTGPNGEQGDISIVDPERVGHATAKTEILDLAAFVIEHVFDRNAEHVAADDVAHQLFLSEQRLAEALIRLEESNRQLEQFAYIAAHELMHPLRAVTAFSDLLPDLITADKRDAVASCVLSIREGTRSMQRQLTELLKLSSVSTDAAELEPIDVQLCANKAIDGLRDQLEAVSAQVTVHALPSVAGQSVQLQSIFHNLIANSIRYRDSDRTLEIEISGQETGGELLVAVEDNGVGIAEADAERVFGVFERASTNDEGFGIGLALSRRIMEHFGGTISVDSTHRLGSRLVLRFPKHPATSVLLEAAS